jgi:arylsulfatase A-like enzyme
MYKKIPQLLLFVGITSFALISYSNERKIAQSQSHIPQPKTPNIVLIVADDMGYSDLSAFGSEIPTPNIDKIAQGGMKITNFRALPTCSPTRSMLLTGVDNHIAGLGTMAGFTTPNQKGKPGYETYLNNRVVTVASLLKDAGYHTYMTGKWHLGSQQGYLPTDRGFEKSFTLLEGAGGHFNDMGYTPNILVANYQENGKKVNLPPKFYSTNYYTDKMIEYINQNRGDGKPFFMFAAYTSPHDPLQAPPENIKKYLGKYDIGWDKIRQQRFQRMKQLGIIPNNLSMIPRANEVVAWDRLTPEQRRYNSKVMAIYAGMVDNLDSNVGRLIEHLKKIGEYDNTMFIFISDNGAAGHAFGMRKDYEELLKKYKINNSYENIGNADSFISYGKGWAQVSATPFFGFKGRVFEGGIRVPAFFYYPGAIKPGTKNTAFASVIDMTPTILDYAEVKHPGKSYQGNPIVPMNGRSLRPLLEGKTSRIYGENDPIGVEIFGDGNDALFLGDWKAINVSKPYGDGQWKLYNIVQDPTESKDLSKQFPDQLKKMIALYAQYEKNVGYVPSSANPKEFIHNDYGL